MSKNRELEYAQALDELDRRRIQGVVSRNEYDVKRARLLAEASAAPVSLGVRVLILAGLALVVIFVMRILVAILQNT